MAHSSNFFQLEFSKREVQLQDCYFLEPLVQHLVLQRRPLLASTFHHRYLPSWIPNPHHRYRQERDISSQSHPNQQHSQCASDWVFRSLFASLKARQSLLIEYFSSLHITQFNQVNLWWISESTSSMISNGNIFLRAFPCIFNRIPYLSSNLCVGIVEGFLIKV